VSARRAPLPPLFAKLQLGQRGAIVVLGAPASFEPQLARLAGIELRRSLRGLTSVDCALAFVRRQTELDRRARALCRRAAPDALLWFAYPKQSSRRYAADFNRDRGWGVLRRAGFRKVGIVSLDADWAALRLRRARG
jgi:hypothetical protein